VTSNLDFYVTILPSTYCVHSSCAICLQWLSFLLLLTYVFYDDDDDDRRALSQSWLNSLHWDKVGGGFQRGWSGR